MECSSSQEGQAILYSLTQWKGTLDFDLRKMTSLMDYLGNPQDKVPSVHVAGTNGKGSVSAAISSILGQTGAQVGLNISPHLSEINERVVINGLPIADDALTHYAREIKRVSEALDLRISMHEGITALSFLAFSEMKLDWMVMEVGLGGRLDASNVMRAPQASVIVSIDFDHEHILGDTLEKIAREKAGIIKPDGNVIIGYMGDEPRQAILKVVEEQGAHATIAGVDFSFISEHDSMHPGDLGRFSFKFGNNAPISVKSGLRGSHQFQNMSVALAAAQTIGISPESGLSGIEGVSWPGRMEFIHRKNRDILIDCAHNPHGVRALVDNLQRWGFKDLTCCFGALDTKNWREMVQLIAPFVNEWHLLKPDSERALDQSILSDYIVSSLGVTPKVYGSNYAEFLRMQEGKRTPLLITGSMYMVGIIREMLNPGPVKLWEKQASPVLKGS